MKTYRATACHYGNNNGVEVELEDGRSYSHLSGKYFGGIAPKIIDEVYQVCRTRYIKYHIQLTEEDLLVLEENQRMRDSERLQQWSNWVDSAKRMTKRGSFSGQVPDGSVVNALRYFGKYLSVCQPPLGGDGSTTLNFSLPAELEWDLNINPYGEECLTIGGYTTTRKDAIGCFYSVMQTSGTYYGLTSSLVSPKEQKVSPDNFRETLPVVIGGEFTQDYTAFFEKEIRDESGRCCIVIALQSRGGMVPHGPHTLRFILMSLWECRELFQKGILELESIPNKNIPYKKSHTWWEESADIKQYFSR